MKSTDLRPDEFHSYYGPYIETLGDVELMGCLENGLHQISDFIGQIPDNRMDFLYAQGKWSIAEVLVHLMDAERVFQYRALRFARNDRTELMGFDQDFYVPESFANDRTKGAIIEEFSALRKSTITFFKGLAEEQLMRSGKANGAAMSVRALGFVICGHQAHHFKILKERYLS